MSLADVKPRTPRQKAAPGSRRPPAPAVQQLTANDVALIEEEQQRSRAAEASAQQPLPDGLVQVRERPGAAREQAHERFLQQYTTDATQVAEVFAELGVHLEQQQESLDKVEDNTQQAVEELRVGITEYADGAKEKAKGAALQKTMVAGAVGGVTAVAAIATGGIALGVAAGAAALVGGVGAQAEYKLVADAAQGEVDAMEVQQALGPLMDKKDWSPDAQARECEGEGCNVVFSMYWRRHHCRSCGGVFCANCAPKAAVRLCTACNGRVKAKAGGRKAETSAAATPAGAAEDNDLMAQWADAPRATAANIRGSSGAAPAAGTHTGVNSSDERSALLGAGKPARGKGAGSASEADALRAAERAAPPAQVPAGDGGRRRVRVRGRGEDVGAGPRGWRGPPPAAGCAGMHRRSRAQRAGPRGARARAER